MAVRGHDDRVRLSRKIAHEVTGQMTARSSSVYLPKKGMKEAAICDKCHLIYQNKRWYLDDQEASKLLTDSRIHRGTCPICRSMEDNVPSASLTLFGDYFRQHEGVILD